MRNYEKERELARERYKRKMEALRADPEALAAHNAKRVERNRIALEKRKARDPEWWKKFQKEKHQKTLDNPNYRKRVAEREKDRVDKIKHDPAAYEAYRRMRTESNKRWLEKVMSDPVRAEKMRARQRERTRRYMERPGVRERYRELWRRYGAERRAREGAARVYEPAPGERFRAKLHADSLYARVNEALGSLKQSDYRDDLAAEAVLIILDGTADDPKEAVRLARKKLNEGAYNTVSMDAVNQYGKSMHEYLTTED